MKFFILAALAILAGCHSGSSSPIAPAIGDELAAVPAHFWDTSEPGCARLRWEVREGVFGELSPCLNGPRGEPGPAPLAHFNGCLLSVGGAGPQNVCGPAGPAGASITGPQGPPGAASTVPGPQGPPGLALAVAFTDGGCRLNVGGQVSAWLCPTAETPPPCEIDCPTFANGAWQGSGSNNDRLCLARNGLLVCFSPGAQYRCSWNGSAAECQSASGGTTEPTTAAGNTLTFGPWGTLAEITPGALHAHTFSNRPVFTSSGNGTAAGAFQAGGGLIADTSIGCSLTGAVTAGGPVFALSVTSGCAGGSALDGLGVVLPNGLFRFAVGNSAGNYLRIL